MCVVMMHSGMTTTNDDNFVDITEALSNNKTS
jgi:hypothetical protein